MRLRQLFLPLLAVPLLTACVNDGATYEIDGTREHVLSLIREQPYFWDKRVDLFLVVARMPACMRRHAIGPGTENSKVEIFEVPSGAFIVRFGKRMFATETQNCVNFVPMDAEPPTGMGKLVGLFQQKKGELVFVKEESEPAPAAQ